MMFISLQDAKQQIEMDHDEDDVLITAYIEAASKSVQNYLKSATPFDDDGVTVKDEVKMATRLLTAYFYRYRDENPSAEFEQGFLPKPVTAILYPIRDPALA